MHIFAVKVCVPLKGIWCSRTTQLFFSWINYSVVCSTELSWKRERGRKRRKEMYPDLGQIIGNSILLPFHLYILVRLKHTGNRMVRSTMLNTSLLQYYLWWLMTSQRCSSVIKNLAESLTMESVYASCLHWQDKPFKREQDRDSERGFEGLYCSVLLSD